MGFFGTYLYGDSGWVAGDPEAPPRGAGPWLWVDVHDSDYATVRYAPAGAGTGVAYLLCTPRTYWDSETESAPTDVAREARGLSEWWRSRAAGARSEEGQEAKRAEIAVLLASDGHPDDPEGLDDPGAQDDLDVAAEVALVRLLDVLDVGVPPGLPRQRGGSTAPGRGE